MSMVTELIAAVSAAERNLDKQIMLLQSYLKSNDDVIRQIAQELSGSTHSSSSNMKQKINQTQEQIKTTINLLETAKNKLQKVRMV